MTALLPLILGTVTMLVSAQLLLKSGMMAVGPVGSGGTAGIARSMLRAAREPRIVGGFALYAVSAACWVYVLSKVELTYAFPFLALGYLGVVVGAVVFLKERPTAAQWAGIALVVTGVALVAVSG